MDNSPNAPHANARRNLLIGPKGTTRFDLASPGGQRQAPPCPTDRRWMDGEPKTINHPTGAAGALFTTGKSQGYAVRTLARETNLASCTNSAARRIQALEAGAQRHRPLRAACSPLAGWHDVPRGSDPLRPPTWNSAANRFEQCGCACFSLPSILPGGPQK